MRPYEASAGKAWLLDVDADRFAGSEMNTQCASLVFFFVELYDGPIFDMTKARHIYETSRTSPRS
jgi:hypothetical protein